MQLIFLMIIFCNFINYNNNNIIISNSCNRAAIVLNFFICCILFYIYILTFCFPSQVLLFYNEKCWDRPKPYNQAQKVV